MVAVDIVAKGHGKGMGMGSMAMAGKCGDRYSSLSEGMGAERRLGWLIGRKQHNGLAGAGECWRIDAVLDGMRE